MAKVKMIDKNRAIELYEKYGSMNRAALSLGCSPAKLKQILLENEIEIKQYKAPRWDIY
jgi:predicted HTH domain antitoxin